MKTIFLDFDGVLFDTVLESYLLARYAYFNISPFEKINKNEYGKFRAVRYLITHSWHYYYIMKLIEDRISIENFSQDFKNALLDRNIELENDFDKNFQEKRVDLINNHFKFWNKLDKPYPFFEKIKHIANNFNIIIVSTKNEEAILRHCYDYGLNIEECNVIGKDKLKIYGSKCNFLINYIEQNNVKNAVFIDDCKETIEKCSDITNLTPLVANWGYVASKNEGLSENKILKIIEENE